MDSPDSATHVHLSPGAELSWRLAVHEAQRARTAELDPLHLLIGILRLERALDPAAGAPIGEQAAAELTTVTRLLRAARLDAAPLRRELRTRLPRGAAGPGEPVRRGAAALRLFRRAADLAGEQGASAVAAVHVLAATLDAVLGPESADASADRPPEPDRTVGAAVVVRLRRLRAATGRALDRQRPARLPASDRPTPRPSGAPIPTPTPTATPTPTPTDAARAPIPSSAAADPSSAAAAPVPAAPGPPGATGGLPGPSGGVPEVLLRFGHDLTVEAERGILPPLIGREAELSRVVRALRRRTKNCPVLVGEAGVGKSAVVEGLAQGIAAGRWLPGRRIVALDLASVLAGTSYRGEFEARLVEILAALRERREIIVFLDEIHTLVGAGNVGGALDAANILKPALARAEIACIGATTPAEYDRYIARDAALERRFQPIVVGEPTADEAVAMLRGLRADLERHHDVRITDEALGRAVALTARYVTDRRLPDKAVDALDEACAQVGDPTSRPADGAGAPAAAAESDDGRHARSDDGRHADRNDGRSDHHGDGHRDDVGLDIRSPGRGPGRSSRRDAERDAKGDDVPVVTGRVVASVVAAWVGLPVALVAGGDDGRLDDLEQQLAARVVGQPEAVAAVARRVRLAGAGLADPERPVGVFLFLGPRGVGKTALARALAEIVGGGPDRLVRLDLGEYGEPASVARLLGAPSGAGPDDAGRLAGPLRRLPSAVLLLERVERAHPDVLGVVARLVSTGRLTDGRGRPVDGRHATVVLASDLPTDGGRRRSVGFVEPGHRAPATIPPRTADLPAESRTISTPDRRAADHLTATNPPPTDRSALPPELRAVIRPELLDRIDAVVIFRPLAPAAVHEVVRQKVAALAGRLGVQHGVALSVSDGALDALARVLIGRGDGSARGIDQLISQLLAEPAGQALLAGAVARGGRLLAEVDGGAVVVRTAR